MPTGKLNGRYIDGRCSRKKYCKDCKKSIATGRKSIRCSKCNMIKNNPFKNKHHTEKNKLIIGLKSSKKFTKEYIERVYRKEPGFKKYINGYVLIKDYNHPNKSKKDYVLEHIKIMSDYLGRAIKKGEIVHHINFIRDDNRLKNLYLCKDKSEHGKIHMSVNNLMKELLNLKIITFKKGKYVMNLKGEMPSVVVGGKS